MNTSEKLLDACVSQTLSKSVSLQESSDLKTTYLEDHVSPLDIIEISKNIAESLINRGITHVCCYDLEKLINECEYWINDEFEVIADLRNTFNKKLMDKIPEGVVTHISSK